MIAVEWGPLPWSRAVLFRGSGWVRPLPSRSAEEAWERFEEELQGWMKVLQTKGLDRQVVFRSPVRLRE